MDVRARRFRARDGILALLVALVIVVVCAGPSIRHSGNEMDAGWQRDLVLAFGKPAGAIGDALPFAGWVHHVTSWVSPDEDLGDEGGFATGSPAAGAGANAVAPVGPEAFDRGQLGLPPAPKRPLHTLLVTGDSMSMPLDAVLARRLASDGVKTLREPHIGTGISKSDLLDWGKLSAKQAREDADAVVVFIGANEGFPFPPARKGAKPIQCCGPDWAAIYASRVRQMMNAYRRDGAARVYWLQLPLPRDPARQKIARAVNAAVAVAAEPYRSQVHVLDLAHLFTPGGRYRVSMDVDGRETVVREPDGIHLNDAGSQLAADAVQRALDADFT
jgi:lysophospholipase L1-like esterase